MERRAWPWKKKINEKIASAALEFRHHNEQLESQMQLKDQPNGMSPLQQAEEKIKILTEQLSLKDGVILQHAKVAEEAVSGWENAESETANVRQQLEAEIQKKLAAEDRVLHLDSALKECMKQLRHLREQQEEKIQEMITKTTREWEGACERLQVEIMKLNSNVLKAEAEKDVMSKLLQERVKSIQEIREARDRGEQEIKVLKSRLGMAEKEQAKWKFEHQVVSKELDIRNEELQCCQKVSEAASKQHLESVKRASKLEAECERLRSLLRKKLPGPTAVAQMRIEIGEKAKRMSAPSHGRASNACKGGGLICTVADVKKASREAIRNNHNEFAHSGAEKLCSTEEKIMERSMCGESRPQFVNISLNQEPSVISISEDGIQEAENNCTESWASALMSELAQFTKKKGSFITETMVESSCSSELMDDFIEMEKLASTLPDVHTVLKEHSSLETQSNAGFNQVLNGGRNGLYEVGSSDDSGNGMDSAEVRDIRVWSPNGYSSCPSEESISRQDVSLVSNAKETHQELALAMHKVLQLIEALSQIALETHSATSNSGEYPNPLLKQEKTSEYSACVESLITLCHGTLLDKVDVMDFLSEMASALDWLVNHVFNGSNECRTVKSLVDCYSSSMTESPINQRSSSLREVVSKVSNVKLFADSHYNLTKELTKLKLEKASAEAKWAALKEELASLKAQLETSTVSLLLALESKQSLLMDMDNLAASKKEVESQLFEAKEVLKKLEERYLSLESQLQDEIQCRKDIEAMYQDLLDRKSSSAGEREVMVAHEELKLLQTSADNSQTATNKEQEIDMATGKLAECQQTIRVIEKQLKDLGGQGTIKQSPRRSPWSDHRSYSVVDELPSMDENDDNDEDKHRKPSNKRCPSRGHGRHGVLSCGGEDDVSSLSIWETNPRNTLQHHRSSTIAPTLHNRSSILAPPLLQIKSPARSPGRFLSLKAWETSPEPSSSPSATERHGNKGFSRFFFRSKASQQHR